MYSVFDLFGFEVRITEASASTPVQPDSRSRSESSEINLKTKEIRKENGEKSSYLQQAELNLCSKIREMKR